MLRKSGYLEYYPEMESPTLRGHLGMASLLLIMWGFLTVLPRSLHRRPAGEHYVYRGHDPHSCRMVSKQELDHAEFQGFSYVS